MRKSSLFSSLSPQRPPVMTSTIPPTPRAMSPSVSPPMTQICPTGCKKKENRAWERGSGRDCHRGFSLLVSRALSSSRSGLVSPRTRPSSVPRLDLVWTPPGINLVQEAHRGHSTVGLSALRSAGRPTGHGPCHHSWVTRPSMNILWFPHPVLLVSGSLHHLQEPCGCEPCPFRIRGDWVATLHSLVPTICLLSSLTHPYYG